MLHTIYSSDQDNSDIATLTPDDSISRAGLQPQYAYLSQAYDSRYQSNLRDSRQPSAHRVSDNPQYKYSIPAYGDIGTRQSSPTLEKSDDSLSNISDLDLNAEQYDQSRQQSNTRKRKPSTPRVSRDAQHRGNTTHRDKGKHQSASPLEKSDDSLSNISDLDLNAEKYDQSQYQSASRKSKPSLPRVSHHSQQRGNTLTDTDTNTHRRPYISDDYAYVSRYATPRNQGPSYETPESARTRHHHTSSNNTQPAYRDSSHPNRPYAHVAHYATPCSQGPSYETPESAYKVRHHQTSSNNNQPTYRDSSHPDRPDVHVAYYAVPRAQEPSYETPESASTRRHHQTSSNNKQFACRESFHPNRSRR